MGCGRSGSFDLQPDWHQWAILHFSDSSPSAVDGSQIDRLHVELYGRFITNWWRRFRCERWTICLELVEGHGSWDGYTPGVDKGSPLLAAEPVAVLTRATIRFRKLRDFWKRVGPVSARMAGAEGLRFSVGIGEAPVYRQATFSLWDSQEQMKAFAYKLREHRDVVRDTRTFKWYSEEMFLRFRPRFSTGTLRGKSIQA